MDAYDMWRAKEREEELALSKLPVCSECGEHIQDETAFYINGEWICENCIDIYRVEVEAFQ